MPSGHPVFFHNKEIVVALSEASNIDPKTIKENAVYLAKVLGCEWIFKNKNA